MLIDPNLEPEVAKFLNDNKQQLVQIYISERHRDGNEGMLFITKNEDTKINVAYIPYPKLPPELKESFVKLKEKSGKPSIIFFYVKTPKTQFIISIDLEV
jgi:hypothetical protein